jgi:hypothetical protein
LLYDTHLGWCVARLRFMPSEYAAPRVTKRDLSLLLTMAIALLLAAGLLALSAVLDAPWLAVVAVGFIVLTLVQRDRYLLRGAWPVVVVGVAVAVAVGLAVEKLT